MTTDILFKTEARNKLITGVNTLADAVTTTLGPRGRNVAIAKSDQKGNVYDRIVLHDGVSVARQVHPTDEYEAMGASILREAAQKQVDEVGDGTTVSILLAQSILNESIKAIAAGHNPMKLRKGLEERVERIVEEFKTYATPVKTLSEKRSVAIISAEDIELGNLIADTIDKVGDDGVITVEETKSIETYVEHQTGMQIDKGYVSPLFVTDPLSMSANLQDPYILITDISLTNFKDILPFLDQVFLKKSTTLVVIAPDFGGDALPSFIQNKLQGNLLSLCINAPSFGTKQNEVLEDIALLTGATFISKEKGYDLKSIKMEDLGRCDRITSTDKSTIISGGKGKKKNIEERIESIKAQIENTTSDFDKEKLRERLGKLSNGIAVIKVGGHTEIEMKERKERALDAVAAVRAAIREGIVAGGETIYLRALSVLGDDIEDTILRDALKRPFYKLLENAGMEPARYIDSLKDNEGINVITEKKQNMVKKGVIDPVLVSINALRNALSVAIQLMTIDAVIVPHKEHEMSHLQN